MNIIQRKFTVDIGVYDEEKELSFEVTLTDPGLESSNSYLTIMKKLKDQNLHLYSDIDNSKEEIYKYLSENIEEFKQKVKEYFGGNKITSNGPYIAL